MVSSVWKLRFKLFLTYMIVGFLPLVIFSAMLAFSLEDYFVNREEIRLKRIGNNIASNIVKENYIYDTSKAVLFEQAVSARSTQYGFRLIVVDKMSIVVGDSSGTEIGKTYINPEIMSALSKTDNKTDFASLSQSKATIHAAVTIIDSNKEVIGAVLLISPIDEITVLMTDIRKSLFLVAIPMAFIIFAMVVMIPQIIISPIHRLLEVVKKMTQGHLNQRIKVRGFDEFSELGSAFNDMSSKLEQVEMTRQEFVSNVSHELKTPLSSMKVLSESLLLQDDLPKEVYREFLQDINSEIDRMTNIVNELLTLVKLDRTENPLKIKPTKINQTVEELIKRLRPIAAQKNIELQYEEMKTPVIDADEIKLSLALSNLVENAIKYTEAEGVVRVTVDGDHQNCFVTVQDNGIGIAEEDQPKVFTRFYRVDKTRDRDTGGTGLGLAITHKTVLLHNGSIKLSSKPDEGSTFTVRLPIHQTEVSGN